MNGNAGDDLPFLLFKLRRVAGQRRMLSKQHLTIENMEKRDKKENQAYAVGLSYFPILLVIVIAALPSLVDRLVQPPFDVHSTGSILISGTSTGIGRATCGHLAENYPDITFYCGVRKLSAADGHPFNLTNVKSVLLDVTKQEEVESVISNIQSPLIGIVANAGIASLGTVEFQPLETVQKQFEVNVFGSLRLTRSALPGLRESKGRVIWVSSLTGLAPAPARWGHYSSTKAAMEKYGDAMRRELGPLGVSVSLVEPGVISSELTVGLLASNTHVDDPTIEESLERKVYPATFDGEWLRANHEMVQLGFSVDSTLRSIQHALFDRHPQSRYMTAGVTVFPTWLYAATHNMLLTDRLADVLTESTLILNVAVSIRKWWDGILGHVY